MKLSLAFVYSSQAFSEAGRDSNVFCCWQKNCQQFVNQERIETYNGNGLEVGLKPVNQHHKKLVWILLLRAVKEMILLSDHCLKLFAGNVFALAIP